jgi:hypothetical protein
MSAITFCAGWHFFILYIPEKGQKNRLVSGTNPKWEVLRNELFEPFPN